MKILLTSLMIIIMVAIPLYAEDIFIDKYISDLQVVMTDAKQGFAILQDAEGNRTEVLIGDTIGVDRAIVTEIKEASITIQTDNNTRTKMPVVYGFE